MKTSEEIWAEVRTDNLDITIFKASATICAQASLDVYGAVKVDITTPFKFGFFAGSQNFVTLGWEIELNNVKATLRGKQFNFVDSSNAFVAADLESVTNHLEADMTAVDNAATQVHDARNSNKVGVLSTAAQGVAGKIAQSEQQVNARKDVIEGLTTTLATSSATLRGKQEEVAAAVTRVGTARTSLTGAATEYAGTVNEIRTSGINLATLETVT